MRKWIVIIGAVLLTVGVLIAAVGLYSATKGFGSVITSFTGTPNNSVTLAPGNNVSVGSARLGMLALVAYTDNASAPIKIIAGSSTSTVGRPVIRNGTTTFVAAIPGLTNASQPILLINNQSGPLALKYSFSQSSLGLLASSGLLILGGGGLFVVGLIVLIVGLVMKKREPPNQTPTAAPPSSQPQI
jgi:hypothetical protein